MQATATLCPRCKWDDTSALRRTRSGVTLLCCKCGLLFETPLPEYYTAHHTSPEEEPEICHF